ncbi:MAG: FliH/SctL family protein [Fervidobacterium sp.]|nr:FliH/SctL family protein [Fervidobacterium sp.]
MLIRKRFVYLDAPLRIEAKVDHLKTNESTQEDEKQKELMEMVARANKEAEQIVFQAQQKANEIILQAQEEYNKIIQQANEQAQNILEQTKQELQISKKQYQDRMIKILQSFENIFDELLSNYAEKLSNISSTLIEKFLEKQIDPEVTKRKLEKVLAHVIGATKVRIHINPDDLNLLEKDLINEIKSKGYEIVPNDSVSYGVIAETDLGTMDTTLKFQFTLLDEIFEEVFKTEK